jgi:cyclopropane-fatty-acyl-phospholipid synthase
MTVEQAQQAKMHHVCRKLRLKAGEQVVEAGSGWGGFALFMAKNYGVNVRTFNISHEQVLHAREWAKREGVADLVEFVEDDYRNMTGQYDAFVSIGMLEHVGVGNYPELGALMSRVLTAEGRGLVHTIGRDKRAMLNPWIDKRIFPGAQPPTLREMMDLFEPNGLSVLDVENIRMHYARTLEHWLERYEERVEEVRDLFDETFVRAWRLYLTGSIAAFTTGALQLFQVHFSRTGARDVPWTRADVYADRSNLRRNNRRAPAHLATQGRGRAQARQVDDLDSLPLRAARLGGPAHLAQRVQSRARHRHGGASGRSRGAHDVRDRRPRVPRARPLAARGA